MLSTGDVFSVTMWKTINTLIFTGFLGLLKNYMGKPLTVILGGESFHKANAVQPLLKELTLYLLPLYSQELNRIEKYWHKGLFADFSGNRVRKSW